jgi:hypothetical protein
VIHRLVTDVAEAVADRELLAVTFPVEFDLNTTE